MLSYFSNLDCATTLTKKNAFSLCQFYVAMYLSSGAIALSYPPLLVLMTLMKKRGWKLYRSPNPNPRGVRKCNSALSSSISASFYIKISVIEAAHSLNLFLLCRHLFWVGNYLRLSKNEIKTLFWFCTYVMFSIL